MHAPYQYVFQVLFKKEGYAFPGSAWMQHWTYTFQQSMFYVDPDLNNSEYIAQNDKSQLKGTRWTVYFKIFIFSIRVIGYAF